MNRFHRPEALQCMYPHWGDSRILQSHRWSLWNQIGSCTRTPGYIL